MTKRSYFQPNKFNQIQEMYVFVKQNLLKIRNILVKKTCVYDNIVVKG